MKIGIYGAGQFVSLVNREIPFIAVDGGLISLNKLNIIPKYIVGDFDSLDINFVREYNHVIQLPCRKDFSDTEVAIQYAIEQGFDEIELYGVTGGRLDHFYAISRLLLHYAHVDITIFDDINKIYILKPGHHTISKDDYDYISFFAIENTVLSLEGVEYPLNNYTLTYDCALCVSNEIIDFECTVINDKSIYCIQAKKGEF